MITMPETGAAVKPALDIESHDSLTASAVGKTYFVSSSGNDNNQGAQNSPFRTISKAIAVVQAGDTVEVMNGTYSEDVWFNGKNGTEANPITFKNYPGHSPILDGLAQGNNNTGYPQRGVIEPNLTVPTTGYYKNGDPMPDYAKQYAGRGAKYTGLVQIDNSSHIVWDGIDVVRSLGRGFSLGNSHHITVKNLDIRESRAAAFLTEYECSDITLQNCYIYLAANNAPFRRTSEQLDWPAAISIVRSTNCIVDRCEVSTTWGETVTIDNRGKFSGANNHLVKDSIFYDGMYAIYIHGVKGVVFERNYIYRSATTPNSRNCDGINIAVSEPIFDNAGVEDIVVRNNIIANVVSHGINLAGGNRSAEVKDITIANNTIINVEGPAINTWSTVNGKNIKFVNNLIYQTGGNRRVQTNFTNTNEVDAHHNYWSGKPEQAWFSDGSDVVSSNSPVVNASHNPKAGEGDPNNYKLVSNALAINAGTSLNPGFVDDFFGSTRVGAWDIGAHESDGKPTGTITADFTASPTSGAAPLQVTFRDQSQSSQAITGWRWDFGDGSGPSTAQNPTHTYQEAGQYTVKLEVKGPAGEDIAAKPDYITVTKEETLPPPPTITTQRVTAGLQVLYHFDEGEGLLVADHSGAGTPLNLALEDGGAVRWLPEGGLELRSPARLKTDGAARKVIDACRQANAVTVEAWLKPANVTQSGPARIVSISANVHERNVTLSQGLWGDQPADLFDVRLRTTERDKSGMPAVTSPAGTAKPALTHVVYTRAQDGTATIYVNGAAVVADKVPGDFSNWDAGFPLLVGNENGDARPWLGELHLAAIYARALSAAEIAQNYQAGHRPAKTATVTADFTIPAEQAQGVSPHPVAFDATGSSATRGIAKYVWSFGDGGAAETTNPIYTYTYKRHGLFDVTLEVVDREGASDRLTRAELIHVEPEPTPSRVTDGLQALYTFLEGQGAVVRDVSQVGQALDLTIRDAAAVRWLPDGLAVEAPTAIASAGAAAKIISACKASHALTVEAWLTPANATQQGPARIVSISKDAYERNVTLAQGLWAQQPPDVYDVRLRTTQTSANGIPSLTSPAGALKVERTHVVYTRGADGRARIYLNGALAVETEIAGDFSSWNDGYRLWLVNEGEVERPWLGTLNLAAIYARALSGDEITQNYHAGLPNVGKVYTPKLWPDTPATFRRFLLQRSTDGSAGAENGAAPPTGYGVQYPNLRCVLLWEGAEAFEIYDSLAALQNAYPRAEAAMLWLDQ